MNIQPFGVQFSALIPLKYHDKYKIFTIPKDISADSGTFYGKGWVVTKIPSPQGQPVRYQAPLQKRFWAFWKNPPQDTGLIVSSGPTPWGANHAFVSGEHEKAYQAMQPLYKEPKKSLIDHFFVFLAHKASSKNRAQVLDLVSRNQLFEQYLQHRKKMLQQENPVVTPKPSWAF